MIARIGFDRDYPLVPEGPEPGDPHPDPADPWEDDGFDPPDGAWLDDELRAIISVVHAIESWPI
jgi:hypothetical protein